MSKDELIEEIKQRRSRLRPCGEGSIATVSDAVFTQCLGLVEELDSQPAMAWQDEPSEDGEHYVDGERCICWVSDDVVYVPTWDNEGEYVRVVEKPLNGRRVCPIPSPPPLPKRGDS